MLVPDLAAYLPAAAYLLVVSGLLWTAGKVPHWVHPALLTAGVIGRVFLSGWIEPVICLGIAAVVFIVLVFLAARTVSGVTLFSIVVALALTPIDGWPGLLVGMLVAALVAGWRTWRLLGKGRVAWLALDTMSAMGISPAGGLKMPEFALIPDRDSMTDVNAHSVEAKRLRMYLPPYLLLGVGVGAAMTLLVS